MTEHDIVSQTIISLEKAALTRWGNGDPSGFIEIADEEIVYFDPFISVRLDGLPALTRYYESIRGQIHYDRFELLNPVVQHTECMAVLTFNYASYAADAVSRWNCTEVYRRRGSGRWLITHSHWSHTRLE